MLTSDEIFNNATLFSLLRSLSFWSYGICKHCAVYIATNLKARANKNRTRVKSLCVAMETMTGSVVPIWQAHGRVPEGPGLKGKGECQRGTRSVHWVNTCHMFYFGTLMHRFFFLTPLFLHSRWFIPSVSYSTISNNGVARIAGKKHESISKQGSTRPSWKVWQQHFISLWKAVLGLGLLVVLLRSMTVLVWACAC